MDERLVVEQLRAGRDFAAGDPIARQMANFVYLIADRVAGECLVVDPAWDVAGIVKAAEGRGWRITGALVTHYHPDHVGGPMFGHPVEGLAELQAQTPCKVHVHRDEADGVRALTGLSESDLVKHDSGDRVRVGEVEVECLHTPGHTPGSQCFRCGDALVAGDTLFLQGCGRVDLPGGDPEEMWRTLTERLASLPGNLELYPGHHYAPEPHAPLDEVRKTNPYLRIPSLEAWLRMMGR